MESSFDDGAHFARIQSAIAAGLDKDDPTWRTLSWERCLQDYGLDPSHMDPIQLTERETSTEAERFDNDMSIIQSQLERTLQIIEGGGYSAHIANNLGVIIEERRSRDETYYCTTDVVGAVWSEEIGGTNGIGTAMANNKPTAVYLTDHFFAEFTSQACAAAPFFKHDGSLLGIINLSTRNPNLPKLAHRVIFGIAQSSAEELELQYFRHHFRNHYTLQFTPVEAGNPPIILAVDDDFGIIGASREARQQYAIKDSMIGQKDIWHLFEKLRGDPSMLELRDSLRELRPLGQRNTVGIQIFQPLNPTGQKSKPFIVPPVRNTTRNTTKKANEINLFDCAGNDPSLKKNLQILQRIFDTKLNILLLGETGVGKDTVARALHFESERAGGPFIPFNCAAVPETLIDSELFGYAGGAFTGANKSGSSGRIVDANRGTLFLDEIGDMPLTLQTRLLRFLETQEVVPLGSGKAQTVDIQIVAATHRDLAKKVNDGLFRQDLYYRLTGFVVTLPALRDREDLLEIAQSILAKESEGTPPRLTSEACDLLLEHDWPGNIRELRNVVVRALRLSKGKEIFKEDIFIDTL